MQTGCVRGERGLLMMLPARFLHSGAVQVLKVGQVHTNYPFCYPNSLLQSSYI